jgi:hypothetical protein
LKFYRGCNKFSFYFSVYEVCDPKYFTPEVCAQQNYVYAGFPYFYSGLGLPYSRLGYPYAIAPQNCGCPLRAGEVNLQNIQWTLPELGGVKAIVKVPKQS